MVRSEGRLVASVRARRLPERQTTWEIGRLMVAPDLSGRGLGRALLEYAEAAAPADITRLRVNVGVGGERVLRLAKKAKYRVMPGGGTRSGTVDLEKRRQS